MDLTNIRSLLPQFRAEFLDARSGRDHFGSLSASRVAGQRNLAEAIRKNKTGEDITDFVLAKLLPHVDTPHNRERGAWVFIAPVVTRDIQQWFEGSGWAKPDDWPAVARLLFDFITTVTTDPSRLSSACDEFRESQHAKGFQSGFLSPILNATRPHDFCLVNSKTKKTLKRLAGLTCYTGLTEYPASNALVHRIVTELAPDIPIVTGAGILPTDVFDTFCHWYVAIYRGEPVEDDEQDTENVDPSVAMRRFFPEEDICRSMCELMASQIELAHSQSLSCWETTVRKRRIRLNVGRLAMLELKKGELRLTLVPEDLPRTLRDALDREDRWSTQFTTRPVTRICAFDPERYAELAAALAESRKEAIRIAAQTGIQTPFHRFHTPGYVQFLERVVGRPLPKPEYQLRGVRKEPIDGQKAAMEPAVAFDSRQSLFHKVDFTVSYLVNSIELGEIGLPELQRPFVWDRTKVRDLFDSMFRGFPVGFLLLWSNTQMQAGRQIGTDPKQVRVPAHLVVDGQQRLTSLFAIVKGAPVLNADFHSTKLEIAFRPRDGRFEVADAAIRKDPEFIPNISALWANRGGEYRFVSGFLKNLKDAKEVRPEDEDIISDNISRLQNLVNYQLNALVVHADVAEDAVADIFVRINNQGTRLEQADFILTLLSVFWPDGRKELEDFARAAKHPATPGGPATPFNYLIQPGPDQMLRASIALGFHRGRMKAVYQILRGRHADTGQFVPEIREAQFARLREAQPKVLNLNDWHAFLQAVRSAGFIGPEIIASENAVIFTYALFLLGKHQGNVDEPALSRLIRRWFTAAILTTRYSGSAETTVDADLADLREAVTSEAFIEILDRKIGTELTGDFWTIGLPAGLETSAALAPQWSAFKAAQVVLSAPLLFSDRKVRDLLDPAMRPTTKTTKPHRLFPRAWLKRQGITTSKRVNQVANLALLEWPQDRDLSDLPPSDYVPRLRPQFSSAEWERMHHMHALPLGWESMEYDSFLEDRRRRMAAVIREAYEALSPSSAEQGMTLADATAEERRVWPVVQDLEQQLRSVVRQKYAAEWSAGADRQITTILGAEAMATIERNRARHEAAYVGGLSGGAGEVLDYCYLGQLGQLMSSNAAWRLFQGGFRDKRALDDLLKSVIPVRNDLAHFRRVPARELERCRIAAEDLLHAVRRL